MENNKKDLNIDSKTSGNSNDKKTSTNSKDVFTSEKKNKIELTYYQARFTQKLGAMLLDFVVFAFLGFLLFFGTKSIVEATPYYQEINEKYDDARLNSSLYTYSSERKRVEDIVTYINYRSDLSATEEETYLVEHINLFFDSLPEYKSELTKEYEEFLLNDKLLYNDQPYFILNEDGEIVKNDAILIPTSSYVDNVYKVYIDRVALAQFLIKTPNVLDYQRYQSNMLLFLEIPLGIVIGATLTFYVIPLIFFRGRKTLGRLAFRIGLLGPDKFNVRFGRFTARFLILLFLEVILSIFTFMIPLIISLSMSAFSKKRQNFHDYMLGIIEVDTYGTKIYKDKFDAIGHSNRDNTVDFKLR